MYSGYIKIKGDQGNKFYHYWFVESEVRVFFFSHRKRANQPYCLGAPLAQMRASTTTLNARMHSVCRVAPRIDCCVTLCHPRTTSLRAVFFILLRFISIHLLRFTKANLQPPVWNITG